MPAKLITNWVIPNGNLSSIVDLFVMISCSY